MKFEKELTVAAPPDRVWAFLWEIERVTRCLPGCTEARTVAPRERYEAVITERVGPFKVRFPLEIHVLEAEAPVRLRAQASGRDASVGSMLKVTLDLRLEPAGKGCRLTVAADADILGKLGALGGGVIQHKADAIMTQFADAVRRELAAETGPA